ncbi:MAG: cell wall-binding repeat-containing protein [Acidimicrobiales bacterium]
MSGSSASSGNFTATETGTYYWVADYSGDTSNAPVSSACGAANESVVVSMAPTTPTTTTLSSSPNPAVAGQEVTYTATVTPNPGQGTVEFTDDGTPIASCGAVPVVSDQAVCDPPAGALGTHTITAVYSGDASFASSVGQLAEDVDLQAIYGQDAIGTAIALSQAEFPTAGSAKAVVLARSDFFSDALAGGPLAAKMDGPLLITEGAPVSSTLDPAVQTEIERVLPVGGTVYVLGGDLALSPNIDTTLKGLGYMVVREAGADEYATAVDIAQALGNPLNIFEATGLNFPDALSAVPAAIQEHGAILLTNGSSESLETYTYIVQHPGDTRYAIGGPLAAAGADAGATAVYGQDLFNTSAAVASYFFAHPSVFGAATAADFPDALGGGVFMATGGRLGPILLVSPGAPLPPEITPYLASLAAGTKGYVFGGPLAVGPAVVTALQLAIG